MKSIALTNEQINTIQAGKRLLGSNWVETLILYIKQKDGKEYTRSYVSDVLSRTPRAYSPVIISRFLELTQKHQSGLDRGFKSVGEKINVKSSNDTGN